MTVEDLLNIVYDEQWLILELPDGKGELQVWGADWIGGWKDTIEEVDPWRDCEVDELYAKREKDPETGKLTETIRATVYPKEN